MSHFAQHNDPSCEFITTIADVEAGEWFDVYFDKRFDEVVIKCHDADERSIAFDYSDALKEHRDAKRRTCYQALQLHWQIQKIKATEEVI